LKLKTYQAWTMAEALAFVKADLGDDAVILHTRTFERGGFFGLGRRTVAEITAARAQDMPRPEPKPQRSGPPATRFATGNAVETARAQAAARAYGTPVGGTSVERAQSRGEVGDRAHDPEADRERTRRLAQAMAIALERQGAADAARRNEEVVHQQVARHSESQPGKDGSGGDPRRHDPSSEHGPAQRFVIVPAAGGASRLSATIVRAGEVDAQSHAAAASASSAAAPASAPSISPTHSSADAGRVIVESRTSRDPHELDAISDFLGRMLSRGTGAESAVAPIAPAAATTAPLRAMDRAPLAEREAEVAAPVSAPIGRPPVGRTPVGRTSIGRGALGHAGTLLREQDLPEELVARLIDEISPRFDREASPSADAVHAALLERLVALLPSDAEDAYGVEPGAHGPRRIAFVGPTGVGKTTTLAKIAATLRLKRGLRVGIVAADTYRIAAVDQLRTYAEILGLPVEVASSPRDAARACEQLSDLDVILIDTAGRSQKDHMKVSELRAFIASAQPDETHLVLSATAGSRTLAREAEAFCALGVDRLVLTKLDEAESFGPLVALAIRLGKRLSFFTHGQEVPDHIEVARSRRLAALVLGSEVR
jgi:flagellar biosynthesis protein FlhF